MGLDEKLLNARPSGKEGGNKAAGEASDSSSSADNADDRSGDFNQSITEAKRQQAEKQEKEKTESEKPNPINQATGSCLKQAWLNLIPSFGCSLVWINIHVFLGMILSNKLFGKLGSEWAPAELQKAQFQKAKELGKSVGTVEAGGLACLDLGCFFVMLGIFVLFYLIISVISFKWSVIQNLLGTLWSMFIS